MKENLLQLLMIVALIATVGFISVRAQSTRQYKAEIPFEFSVGQKSYPAGKYVISVRNSSTNVEWTLVDEKGKSLQLFYILMNDPKAGVSRTSLLFSRLGGRYALADMVTADYGLHFVRPKMRIPLEPETAQRIKPDITSVVLDR